MRLDDEAWAKWCVWIARIKDDIQPALTDEEVFEEFSKVTEAHSEWITEHHGWHFCRFVARCYSARAAMMVRRQIKVDDKAISLRRLLLEMQKCAPQINFGGYTLRFSDRLGGRPIWQEVTFRGVAPPGTEAMTDEVVASPEVMGADLERLSVSGALIEEFVDRRLAHDDKRGFDEKLTWRDLSQAAKEFDRVACKYIAFLTGDGYDSLKPVVQFPWQQVFDNPLRQPQKHGGSLT